MTNLLSVVPDFDTQPYTHILPSLEKALVSTADLLTLDPLDVAKRAQVPPGEVRKFVSALLEGLHGSLSGCDDVEHDADGTDDHASHAPTTRALSHSRAISTLDDKLDLALGGGLAVGKVTEFVGESAAGKTQFLLTLLLAVQLPTPHGGLGKAALYISTEAPLQTSRLSQLLDNHPKLASLSPEERPSLSRVHSAHVHDLEAQDHILRFQVPVAIRRHDIGLLVIDSIAANYRPEFDKGTGPRGAAEAFVKRNHQVSQLGVLLRRIAETHGIAVVVANQVADRFAASDNALTQIPPSQQTQRSRPASPPPSHSLAKPPPATPSTPLPATLPTAPQLSTDDPLSLDHQHRFFTGWGDDPRATQHLKTPSLGLAWTNQLAARIALLRTPVYEARTHTRPGDEPDVSGWERKFKVVFSEWCAEGSTGFEIWGGGVRAVERGEGGGG
ncbi:DNA repair protein rhp57 [Teratosphaeriaceae sp. CCFEE 6253]|nr:DNA repair protein rhp57 [Teratosphaeriaceae sp. CCFEE 6253]